MVCFSRQTLFSLKNYLRNLDLFEPEPDSNEIVDEQQHRSNIIATRVYLVALTVTLIFLVVFSSLSPQIITITLKYPNEEQFNALPHDAQCVCSRISLPYGEFTSLQPIFNQVCSSDFISDRFINAIFTGSNATYFSLKDFRNFGSAQFQALAAFCRLSAANVQQSIASFDQNTFISSQVLSKDAFQLQIKSAINQFQQTAPRTFTAQLELIRQVTTSNRLVSGLHTNYIIEYYSYTAIQNTVYWHSDGTGCDCLNNFMCASDAVFDDIFGASTPYISGNIEILPGISSGCLPMSSILASTLECFYNQTCLDNLISFFPTTEKFSAMTVTNKSRFGQNATVQSMVDNLMVENWTMDISYPQYYNQCAPSSCSYSKEERHDMIYVLTKLISLLSGVTLILGLIIPMVVQFVMKKRTHEQSPKIPIRLRLQQLKTTLKNLAIELNIFKHYPSNDRQIRYQRNATRLYLFLIVISVGILTQYNLISTTTRRQTMLNPSESQYHQLENTYSTGISCPCSSISIPYSTFMAIQAQYHQLCKSYLISPQWFSYTRSTINDAGFILDYRTLASSQFQTLTILCQQAQQTINDSLSIFLQTQTVSSRVIRQQLFESQMYALIEDWQSTIVKQFVHTVNITQITTLANQLMNRLNIYFHSDENAKTLRIEPRLYDGCNCAFSGSCHISMGIYTSYNLSSTSVAAYSVPNFFVGCFLIDALLLSTLECFYDESCMTRVDQYLDSSLRGSMIFPALNATINPPTETVQSIINRLMVSSWTNNVSFSDYYKMCAPSSCTVEYNGRNSIFNVITIVIGVCGGLTLGFKMLILLVLRLIEKFNNNNNFSLIMLIHSIKRCLSCGNEKQMTRRLHIALVVIILSIVYIFYTFNPQLVMVESTKPSLAVYERLAREHSDSLQCSCSEISIQYQAFLNITPSFHPACSRDFIGELWVAVLTANNDFYRNVSIDYIYSAIGQLQALASLCKISRDTVYDSLSQLLSSHLINTQLFSPTSLSQRIQTTINDYRIITPKLLINIFSLIRESTGVNKLMTTFSSNWIFAVPSNVKYGDTLHTVPVNYQGCNCGLSSKCVTNRYGVLLGCYVLEAFLQSTFECLYDQECLDKSHTVPPLNISVNPSRFPLYSSVESILNELMIEDLSRSLSYANYFTQCAPSSCVYSYIEKSNLIEGITILISLYGGLVIICRLLAVVIVKLLQRRPPTVAPVQNAWVK